jgi:hypothetical protein
MSMAVPAALNPDTDMAVQFVNAPERRAKSRFPLHAEVSYRAIDSRTPPVSGMGVTLNIGSKGVFFTTRDRLLVGRTVELAVKWPAKLGGTFPLTFVAVGPVVRSDHRGAAVRIHRSEFRTGISGE